MAHHDSLHAPPSNRDTKAIPQSEEEIRFDRMRRELVFEARGAPGERARTVDELAELERQRLEVTLYIYSLMSQGTGSVILRFCTARSVV